MLWGGDGCASQLVAGEIPALPKVGAGKLPATVSTQVGAKAMDDYASL